MVARLRVLDRIRRRQHQHAIGAEHARQLREHAGLVGGGQVLDRLERHGDVHAGVRERQRGGRALHEAEVRASGVGVARVRDRLGGNVHADHRRRDAGEQRAAVAFAARHVEHAPPRAQRPRERVAVPVLVGDLAGDAGHEALAGEFEFGGHGKGGRGPRRRRGRAVQCYACTHRGAAVGGRGHELATSVPAEARPQRARSTERTDGIDVDARRKRVDRLAIHLRRRIAPDRTDGLVALLVDVALLQLRHDGFPDLFVGLHGCRAPAVEPDHVPAELRLHGLARRRPDS